VVLIIILTVAAVYAVDFLSIRVPIPPSRQTLGKVRVRPEWVVRLKNGKDDISFGDPEVDTCSNSLFPQMGYTPCWYMQRHQNKEIDVR